MADVESELSVRREELVQLALLLGSDYTDGVHGVGIVNAMEVISSFTEDAGGLQAFSTWVRGWRNDADAGAPVAGEGAGEGAGAAKAGGEGEGAEGADPNPKLVAYKKRHQKVRRNWAPPSPSCPPQASLQPSRQPSPRPQPRPRAQPQLQPLP